MIGRVVVTALLLAAAALTSVVANGAEGIDAGPTPGVRCGPGSLPEEMQGRAPASDVASGRAAKGYTCNATVIGRAGVSGGYRVERYVDPAGHECAFHDSSAFVGENAAFAGPDGTGVYVLDVSDPSAPVRTATLRTPAMQSPHESLRLHAKRGLLVAATSSVASGPGILDVYDVATDCRQPRLLSSTPLGVLGHEGSFAPDGLTYYVTSLLTATTTAVDLTDPALPTVPWITEEYAAHGTSVSLDGNRLYVAESRDGNAGFRGLTILDVTQVQARVPFPTVTVISRTTWPQVSIPQNATPFTRDGKPYVLEVDEFGERITGAARILDVADERHPKVVSNMRLAVNQPEVYDELQADPGNSATGRGYQAHYCSLPSRVDPNIVACGFILSGLRVFDIRDVRRPVEIAYVNLPRVDNGSSLNVGSFTVAAPAYDPVSKDIWFADANAGFFVARLAGRAAIPFADRYVAPGS
ncbi:MAG: hypothetical protein JWP11_1799 [Frankiales bacterium]|nr:hypothetical protein [Frankiales bacterium]